MAQRLRTKVELHHMIDSMSDLLWKSAATASNKAESHYCRGLPTALM